MDAERRRVALLGSGRRAEEWAAAVSDAVDLTSKIDASTDAVIIAPGSRDPFGLAKDALQSGASVLYAAPFQLNPWQAAALEELSRREVKILRFWEPFQYQTGFHFLQRLLAGREPFWRPLYLRSLCIKWPGCRGRLDDLATQELALYDSLIGAAPRSVSAVTVNPGDSTQACAASITVEYDGGPSFHMLVSLVESGATHQLVAVAPERTVLFDQLDRDAPLHILGADEESHEMALPGHEAGGECDDVVKCEVDAFLQAARDRDVSYGNASRWARVATVWHAARESMSFGGSVELPGPVRTHKEPPPLTVIEGGGHATRKAGRRPALTLVAG